MATGCRNWINARNDFLKNSRYRVNSCSPVVDLIHVCYFLGKTFWSGPLFCGCVAASNVLMDLLAVPCSCQFSPPPRGVVQ